MNRLSTALVTACALSFASPASAALLERNPYLQSTTTTSTTIAWTTWLPSTGEVHYGLSPVALTTVVPSPDGSSNSHQVPITGLTPDTRYYYEVHGDGAPMAGDDSNHYFDTNPVVGTREPFRAWVVGDSGTGGLNQMFVRDAMLGYLGAEELDLFLHMGDMAYGDGEYLEFTFNFYAPYADILRNTTVWPTMGNHEGHSSDSDTQSGPYYEGYVLPTAAEAGGVASGTEAYYAFDYANVHFIVLDSHDSPREPDGTMLTWLASDLAATTQEWIVAYWHHPPYTKGSHDSDVEGQLIDMRENALPILESGGVDLVLTGHSHIYERSYLLHGGYETPTTTAGIVDSGDGQLTGDGPYEKDATDPTVGTVHIVAGHGGTGVSGDGDHPVMYFSEVANGSVLLEFHENKLNITNVRWDGTVTDTAMVVKGDAIVVVSPDGGEDLSPGSDEIVEWVTVGTIPDVDLEWSCDGGETWLSIASGVPNTNSYTWSVPSIDGGESILRVASAADSTLSDISNGPFVVDGAEPCEPPPADDDDAGPDDDDSAPDDDDTEPDDDDTADDDDTTPADDDDAADDDDITDDDDVTLDDDDSAAVADGCTCAGSETTTGAVLLLFGLPGVVRRRRSGVSRGSRTRAPPRR